jgi:hypothetical protein
MAEGLSFPALSPAIDQGLRSFLARTGGGSSLLPESSTTTSEGDAPEDGLGDLLDFGRGLFTPSGIIPPGRFDLAPDGTYQFSRFAVSASIDFSFSQSALEVGNGEGGTTARASLTELNLSISVSVEFEQALIETGRRRQGNPTADFRRASQAVVDRFVAEQVRATISFNLSFSNSSLSFNSLGEGLGDLSGFEGDETLGGYVTLLQAFFGDDERFKDFIQNLESFLQGFRGAVGGATPPADIPADTPQPTEGTAPQGGQTVSLQSTRLNASLNLSFESTRVEFSTEAQQGESKDPIVLDLDGDGIELTSATEGVLFDLDADGQAERTATATGGDGLLALDRNGNGTIDDGRELFGDQNGAANGFEELARFDSNGDGSIDARDIVFDQLRVFVDSNRDGVSQTGELFALSQLGIASINLGAKDVDEAASGGNRIAQRSFFTRNDGTRGVAVDALLHRLV